MRYSFLVVLLVGCGNGPAMTPPVDAGMETTPPADAGMELLPPDQRTLLSETGLYSDIGSRTVASDLVEYEPAHHLWSDGADKRRWMRLPPGTQIDTTDMDHWVFPEGTQFFKEFALGGVELETRLIERTGPGPSEVWMGTFVWRADGTDAVYEPLGRADINGTTHDAPSTADCNRCHMGEAGRILGFSATQLSKPGPGVTFQSLAQMGLLSASPGGVGVDYPAPGTAIEAAALGYLHANCGHCHNPTASVAFIDMDLRLYVAERDPALTAIYRTTVGVPLADWVSPPFTSRIVPADPAASAILYRMEQRGSADQMPPIASEEVDATGVGAVSAWVSGL